MTTYRSLNHTKWHCQYHVVFIPKYRKKAMYGGVRQQLGEVRGASADHVHMLVSIEALAQVIGYLKGKSAMGSLNFVGSTLGARVLDGGP